MSRRSRASTALLLSCATLAGCASSHRPNAAELAPIVSSSAARQPLPNEVERAVRELVSLTLRDRTELSGAALDALVEADQQLVKSGAPSSGLVENARALRAAAEGVDAYTRHALEAIESDGAAGNSLDPALRRQFQRHLDARPLEVARRHLKIDRKRKFAALFNRVLGPAIQIALGSVNPIETGRAALASVLTLHSFPAATIDERRALRAYRDFAARSPRARENAEARAKIADYGNQLRHHLHAEALAQAELAIAAGRPDAALPHLERAGRLLPSDAPTLELLGVALDAVAEQDRRLRLSRMAAPSAADTSVGLVRALLVGSRSDVMALAAASSRDEREADERDFARAAISFDRSAEDPFFRQMEALASSPLDRSNMARHAQQIVYNTAQNPYAYYKRAQWADLNQRMRWLLFGRYAGGAKSRDLPRPLEWLLDVPGIAVAVLLTPMRVLQYPLVSAHFGGSVLHAGEAYLAHFPAGSHAQQVRRDLEQRYADRGLWRSALAKHEDQDVTDPDQIAEYREQIATRGLEMANSHPRIDAQISIYRSIASEYSDTESGRRAAEALLAALREATPHEIRISKEFLAEFPELWAAGALGLRPELMDGDDDNGELGEAGVTLLGRSVVRIELEGAEPVTTELPPEQFARFVAGLEEASYRRLASDDRDRAEPDPQRDLFFERAKLGLVAEADLRPAASSRAVYLSSKEKFGSLVRRDSILPVDVVLQGGLEDFGFAALPRIRVPRRRPDSFLYR